MKIKYLLLALMIISPVSSSGEDYQYQDFNNQYSGKKKYVPFSDYIPKIRRHFYTHPHYVEDFYLLYGMKQHYNENSLRKNIERLKVALDRKFRHPSKALVKIESSKEYYKYRNLMFMHINLLIMRNYLKIGFRFDKNKIYWYDMDHAKMLQESLKVANDYFNDALPYWRKAKNYALRASQIKVTTDLGHMETERFNIKTEKLDYGKIIRKHIERVKKKQAKLNSSINDNR